MDYFDIKYAKMRKKAKMKHNNIIKNARDAFPSFLSTKHFYKRRSTMNVKTAPENDNKEPFLSKYYPKSIEKLSSNNTKKHHSVLLSETTYLNENKQNQSKKLSTDGKDFDNIFYVQEKLSPTEKMKLKSILKNFEYNKLTTNSLINREKKTPLNSVTESNYLFLFSDYKNKKKKNKKDVDYIKSNLNSKISKSSLISLNMMKKFNKRTNRLLEVQKFEGTKFSNNVNEFRKQIINSYKDTSTFKDLYKRKINYDNAMKLIESTKEKRIREAFELEKEFYKNKNCENPFLYEKTPSVSEDVKMRKNRKNLSIYKRKINEKINTLSPQKKRDLKHRLSMANSKRTNILKINDSPHWTNNNNNSNNNNNKIINILNNLNNLNNSNFNKAESCKINENHNNSIMTNNNKILSESNHNSIRKSINNNNNNNSVNINTYINKNDINKKTNNNSIFLNYVNNTKHNNKYKQLNQSEIEFWNTKEDYNKYMKNVIKERAKQFADSLAGINSYFQYQPLIDMNSDMPHLNINITNLRRVIKVNNIKKNLYSLDDDDLLVKNIKKLKDEIREAEIRYYTVDCNKKKYHLSFLKNEVKPQTNAKLNHMKNPHFGVPC